MSDELNQPTVDNAVSGLKQYKMMTNVLNGSMNQTRYVKSLEKVTSDPQVPYNRLLYATGLIGLAVILYAIYGILTEKIVYVGIFATMIFLGVVILAITYLVSSRTKSMLETTFLLMISSSIEKIRRKNKEKGDLKSMGIDDFKNGIIYFKNGDKGVMYDIDGQLNLSTLPSVAEAVAKARERYLVARSGTSQEQMIVSIKEIDTTNQQKHLIQNFNKANNINTQLSGQFNQSVLMGNEIYLRNEWIKYMSNLKLKYIQETINDEYIISECLILRDQDMQSLKGIVQTFEHAVNDGLYSKVERVMTRKHFLKNTSSLAMLSKQGVLHFGKE